MERQMMSANARSTVATFTSYADAQRAVDYLSDQKFPVERTAIVAEGLKLVEQVTGRLNYGRAALGGALSGATTGALIGVLLSLFNPLTPIFSLLLYGLVIGAIIGAIMSVITYAATGGRRDFASVSGMQADRYNVMVDTEVAGEAQRLLNGMQRV